MSTLTTELPSGWTEAPIEEFLAPLKDGRILHQGWSPQCEREPSESEENWGVLKTTAIQAGVFLPEQNKRLPSSLTPRPALEVESGDILLTCAGPRGRCGVACLVRDTRKRLMISGKMYRFRVRPDRMDSRYLEAFLQTDSAQTLINKMKTGISDSGLNLTHDRFRRLPVRAAPLEKQQQIVAEIEKQFTRLEAGVAGLRRVQANLKRYRAAVLKAACEGKLVATEAELARQEGRTYETGAQLLERILTERRQKWNGRGRYKEPAKPDTAKLSPLPTGWAWTTMDAVIISGPQNGIYLPKASYGRGCPILRIDDFQEGWVRDRDELHMVTGDPETLKVYRLRVRDLIINRVNSPSHLGKCLIVRDSLVPAVFESNMMRAVLSGLIHARYVELYLRSVDGHLRLNSNAKWAVNQASINQQDVKSTALPLPPYPEQQRIVAEVERHLSIIEELEAVVNANVQRATRLRQSILQQSFTGELGSKSIASGYHE